MLLHFFGNRKVKYSFNLLSTFPFSTLIPKPLMTFSIKFFKQEKLENEQEKRKGKKEKLGCWIKKKEEEKENKKEGHCRKKERRGEWRKKRRKEKWKGLVGLGKVVEER